uniref:Uncharacterized protein n=2 Tax=Enterobacteriaceae TaxID=543 RepID=A0A2R4KLK8_ECOLX|nr:hypothetical protein [Kluyvera cryocrescens]AVV60490.1 Hypothetical protein [Escherichia coli]
MKLIIAFSIRFELQEPNAGGYGKECINMGCESALFEQMRKELKFVMTRFFPKK